MEFRDGMPRSRKEARLALDWTRQYLSRQVFPSRGEGGCDVWFEKCEIAARRVSRSANPCEMRPSRRGPAWSRDISRCKGRLPASPLNISLRYRMQEEQALVWFLFLPEPDDGSTDAGSWHRPPT